MVRDTRGNRGNRFFERTRSCELGAKLKKDQWHETALETLNLFRIHERIRIINIDETMFERAYEIFVSFPGLSLTDASTVAVMENIRIRKLYSFDRGFDRIRWIERLE